MKANKDESKALVKITHVDLSMVIELEYRNIQFSYLLLKSKIPNKYTLRDIFRKIFIEFFIFYPYVPSAIDMSSKIHRRLFVKKNFPIPLSNGLFSLQLSRKYKYIIMNY